MPTAPKKNAFVVQSNSLIEARYSLTAHEQRFILALVSKIKKNDADFITYEITLRELAALMNLDMPRIYHEIEQLCRLLMSRVLTVRTKTGWKMLHWLSYCEYHKEKTSVYCRFDISMKPYLLLLKEHFTKYQLSVIAGFKSIYSIRIYQLLKQYQSIGSRTFAVDELKKTLGITEKQYPDFQDFKKRIINQAVKEFEARDENNNPRCDITFQFETIKKCRKIEQVKFIILPTVKLEPPTTAQTAKKHPPLSAEMKEFKKHLEKIGDKFLLDTLKTQGPQEFMVRAAFANWQRAQA